MLRNFMIYVLMAIVFAIFIATFFLPLHPDEAVFGTIGNSLLHGKILYADLFDHKPPGIHYLLTGAFYLFGNSLETLRMIVVVVLTASGIGMLLLLSELNKTIGQSKIQASSGEVVGWSASTIIFLAVVHGTYLLTELIAVPFFIFSLYYIVRHQEKWSYVLSGLFLGVCFIFKQTTIPIYAPLSIYTVWYISRRQHQSFWRNGALITGSSMVPIILVTLHALWVGNFHAMLQDVIWFNIVSYPSYFSISTIYVVVYVLISLISVWIIGFQYIRNTEVSYWQKAILNLYIMSVVSISIARPYHHYWILIVPLGMVIAYIARLRVLYSSAVLFANAIVAGSIFLVYSVFFSYPSFLYQTQPYTYRLECKQDMTPTDYFFSGCLPTSKYFFRVE